VKIFFSHFHSPNKVFNTNELLDTMDFFDSSKIKLRKCIMDLSICLNECRNYDLDKYKKLLMIYDEFVSEFSVHFCALNKFCPLFCRNVYLHRLIASVVKTIIFWV
jgi:hypothetical protein